MAISLADRDIVVIGASAGGVDPLIEVITALPPDSPAAFLVAVHMLPDARSALPRILESRSRIRVSHPDDGEPLEKGHVYVAPPDFQMGVEDSVVRLNRGPREHGYRPSIDALFRTAAHAYGSRVIGILLSGALSDGVLGLWDIKDRGGLAIVQDPSEATFASMPEKALHRVEVDDVLPARDIGRLLATMTPAVGRARRPGAVDEVSMDDTEEGRPSVFSCPDSGSVLSEAQKDELVR